MKRFFVSVLFVLTLAGSAEAQELPAPILEGAFGYARFVVDDETINHTIVGGGGRLFVMSRLAVGPEFVYMKGPDLDRDLLFTGTVTLDLVPDVPGRTSLVPYVVGSAGILRHADQFAEDLTTTTSTITGGGGVRIDLGGRIFVAPEVRFGRDPQIRFSVSVGTRTR